MRFRPHWLLGILLLLGACQPSSLDASGRKGPATRKPSPEAKASPAAPASPTSAYAALLRPEGDVRVVTGRLTLDAGYVVAKAAGALLDGGRVGVGDAGFVASVLGEGEANLLSDAGGGLVSDHGGGLVGNHAGSWRILAETPGATRAAVGMRLRATDLSTAVAVTLGVDAEGKRVTEVYTNAQGAYTLYLPAHGTLNLRLEGAAPKGTDERLTYLAIADAQQPAVPLDEDTRLVSRFMRETAASQLNRIYSPDGISPNRFKGLSPDLAPQVEAIASTLTKAANEAGFEALSTDQRLRVTGRMGDVLLAYFDLHQVPMLDASTQQLGEPRDVVGELVTLLGRLRVLAAARLAERSSFFAESPAFAAGGSAIVTPADVPEYLVRRIITNPDATDHDLEAAFAALGASVDDAKQLVLLAKSVALNVAVLMIVNDEVLPGVVKALHDGVAEVRDALP